MKIFLCVFLLCLTSCETLPQLYSATESIIDDDAISVSLSREAVSSKSNILVSISVGEEPK